MDDIEATVDGIAIVQNNVGAQVRHVPKFSGNIWYVNAGASASGDGTTPDTPFLTIGEGITAMANGDAITVHAGTYTEVGLDLSNNDAELWWETGVIIDPVSGTGLTVSGDFCVLKGNVKIMPALLQIGLLVTGAECIINSPKVLLGAVGIRVTGQGVVINDGAVGFPTSIAYDLQGEQGRLENCKTVGNAATIGYNISNGVDTGVLDSCTSAGHATSGFTIETGSSNWTVLNCSSGGGDGRWVDVDHANVFSNFTYDDELHNIITLDGSGTYNIYQITGDIEIERLRGVIETATPALTTAASWQLFPVGGAAVQITSLAGADISSLPAGSMLSKDNVVAQALTVSDNTNGFLNENLGFLFSPFAVGQKTGVVTYIRLNVTEGGASGAIDFVCEWKPVSDTGFLAAV